MICVWQLMMSVLLPFAVLKALMWSLPRRITLQAQTALSEVARIKGWASDDIIVNVQGDRTLTAGATGKTGCSTLGRSAAIFHVDAM